MRSSPSVKMKAEKETLRSKDTDSPPCGDEQGGWRLSNPSP
jgi:hypothetical protein